MVINNRFTRWMCRKIHDRVICVALDREPDFIVGDNYLERWWIIPRNPIFNVYLHRFWHDDEDRACHCHPWQSMSFVLSGPMREVRLVAGEETVRRVEAGDIVFRGARAAHRMIVPVPGSMTLFLTGPRVREWGFWCEGRRFVPWRQFVDQRDAGQIGRGCE